MRRLVVFFAMAATYLLISITPLVAQPHARADYEFGHYLLGNGLLRDALTLVEGELHTELYTPAALDSLNHLRGWTHYNLRNFDAAASDFGRVHPQSPLYAKSLFYGAVSSAEVGRIVSAEELLRAFADSSSGEQYAELLAFERAGVALLQGDSKSYAELSKQFTYSDFALADEQRNLDMIASTSPRNLKPWVAGLASAVVPGLGQIYAGNLGEGLASLLLVGAMAGLTAESWTKAGTPANWRTILYGSVGTLLYVGNICGSVASVKLYYQKFDETRSEAVMCSLHIPLRTIFK